MANLIQRMQNVLDQADPLLPAEVKRVILKELLQAYVLDFLYNHPNYRRLNFYGGSCLHVVYGLNRLSEDIDLDNSAGVELSRLEPDLLSFFRIRTGYLEVTAKTQEGEWGVQRTTLKFPLLAALGLTTHASEVLHLKVEVSQHKQTSVIRKTPLFLHGRSLVAAHFSLETMMAGKMIACLERTFQKGKGAHMKGRDLYDLLWFMQHRIQPLEEKLAQDGHQAYTLRSAMELLGEKVARMEPAQLAEDLLPLFEQRTFIQAWLETFQQNFSEFAKYYHP